MSPFLLSRRQLLQLGGLGAAAAVAGRSLPAVTAEPTGTPRPFWFGYSLNTGTIRGQKLPLADEIDVAAKAGYDAIEPWVENLHKHVESGGSLADLRKRCQDSNLKVCSAIGFASWIVDDDAQRAKGIEQLKRDMEAVAQLGGTHIAAPPAGATKPEVKLDLNRAAQRYREILELGRRMGVVPQLEIWGGSANLSTAAEAFYVAARCGDPDACLLLDVFHLYRGGTPWAALSLVSKRAAHVFHINDYPANLSRETCKDSDRLMPGDGVAPLAEMLARLADNHCRLFLSLELFNRDYWQMPALEAAKTGLAKTKAVVAAARLA